jgi:hypothetical protein
MRVPEPLRYQPFAFRKRPSLTNVLYGDQRPVPIRVVDNEGSPSARTPANYSPPVYMGGLPKEYVPEVGPMHVPASDYRPYEATMPPMPARPPGPTRGMGTPAPEPSQGGMGERDVTYEDGLLDEDLLAIQLKLALAQSGGTPIAPADNDDLARLLSQGHAVADASEFDRDLRAHHMEIQMAVERMRAELSADPASGLPGEALCGREAAMDTPTVAEPAREALDPSRYEPQDFFERETELIARQFAGPDLSHHDFGAGIDALVAAQDALFRSPIGTMDQPMPGQPAGPEPANLEQIIEAHDIPPAMMPNDVPAMPTYEGCLMTPDLFNRQMQNALGGMMPQGLYGDPALSGYCLPGTYDEQMLQMMDPYAVPGRYDPVLPGPTPDFGPGPGP